MSQITIGRMGLDVKQTNVATASFSGDSVVITGKLSSYDPGDLFARTQQLVGLKDNPDEKAVPITYDDDPNVDGFYVIEDASVDLSTGSFEIGWWDFSVTARPVHGYAAPLIEARLSGFLRYNYVSISTPTYWHGVPGTASAYTTGDASLDVSVRQSEDGNVRIIEGASLADSWPTWYTRPGNWYDGSARIESGDNVTDATVPFSGVGSLQTYVVPDGVYRVRVLAAGAQGSGQLGGLGARLTCILAVTPGETLNIRVGTRANTRAGGWPNAGDGGDGWFDGANGYGGGGETDIRQGGDTAGDRVVVAGGGGGQAAPRNEIWFRGGMSSLNGRAGTNPNRAAGQGGTQSAGGRKGRGMAGGDDGAAGGLGTGGNGADAPTDAHNRQGAGGGGGGYYGGGGGALNFAGDGAVAGCGGAGSSFTDPDVCSEVNYSGGGNAGEGLVEISPIFGEVASSPAVPLPTTLTSDTFNRADDDLVGSTSDGGDTPADWVAAHGLMLWEPSIVSNKVKTSDENGSFAALDTDDLDDFTIAATVTIDDIGVLIGGRYDGTVAVGLLVEKTQLSLVEIDNSGVTSTIASVSIEEITSATDVALQLAGTAVNGFINGASPLGGTTAITDPGKPFIGFGYYDADNDLDSTIDDVVVTLPPVPPDPIEDVADVIPNIAYYPVVGHQIADNPLGWRIANGIVDVRPGLDGQQVLLVTRCWGPSGWSEPLTWRLCRGATIVPTYAQPRAVTVLRNSPEECAIRVTYAYEQIHTVTLDITLRRGATQASIHVMSSKGEHWGLGLASWDDGTTHTGGMTATSADDDGNRWQISSPFFLTYVTSFNAGFYAGIDLKTFYCALGWRPSGCTTTAAQLTRQYMAAMREETRAVSR